MQILTGYKYQISKGKKPPPWSSSRCLKIEWSSNETDAYIFQRKHFKYEAQIYMVVITDHSLRTARSMEQP